MSARRPFCSGAAHQALRFASWASMAFDSSSAASPSLTCWLLFRVSSPTQDSNTGFLGLASSIHSSKLLVHAVSFLLSKLSRISIYMSGPQRCGSPRPVMVEDDNSNGYVETDPTGRYGRVSFCFFSSIIYIYIYIYIYMPIFGAPHCLNFFRNFHINQEKKKEKLSITVIIKNLDQNIPPHNYKLSTIVIINFKKFSH
jgi:hypothetical protein